MAHNASELATAARLERFFGLIGTHLKDRRKRESFAMYALGILGDGERKSAEPIAARACGDPKQTNNVHSKLLYFLGCSAWNDRAVRLEASRYALEVMQKKEPVVAWIIDDTGFLKQGTHSVGVQRQYTGSAGKIANCQIGVSLCVSTGSVQLPVDFELYLPERWTDDADLRAEARIPDAVTFKTKVELAVEMLERAVQNDIPPGLVLADSFYGDHTDFRNAVRSLGLHFAVGVASNVGVVRLDRLDRAVGSAQPIAELVAALSPASFRTITWRDGSRHELRSRFAFVRVKTTHDDGLTLAQREPQWLVAEWPEGEQKASKFVLTSLPRSMSKKKIVRLFKERWRTERMYEDLKGELGLDHFEGRSFPGWHHHVSVVLCCYAFVVAERVSAFPPSGARTCGNDPVPFAA